MKKPKKPKTSFEKKKAATIDLLVRHGVSLPQIRKILGIMDITEELRTYRAH